MAATRNQSLLELSILSENGGTNTQVKSHLGITSFDPTPINSQIASISGVNNAQTISINNLLLADTVLTARTAAISANTIAVSAQAEIDIYNLDLQISDIQLAQLSSFTVSAFSTIAPSSAPISASMWFQVSVSGQGPYWIPSYV